MDIDEKRIDALNQVSKLQISCYVVTLCISAYMFDRTVKMFGDEAGPLDLVRQVEGIGLEYSYFTLSILWPLILGVFSTMFFALTIKAEKLRNVLSKNIEHPEMLVATSFDSKQFPKLFLIVSSWLPITILIFYSLSLIGFVGFSVLYEYLWQGPENDIGVFISLLLYLLVLPIGIKLTAAFKPAVKQM